MGPWLRFSKPYAFRYRASAKRRWIGRQLLAVVESEFGGATPGWWARGIADGRVRVNGRRASPEQVLRDSDVVTSHVVKYEPPALACPGEHMGGESGARASVRGLI